MKKKKLLTDRSGSLYEQQVNEAAKQLAEDIDFEVLTSLFIESGWTKVVLAPMTWEESDAIDLWIHKNIKGQHIDRGLVFLFKEAKDANWFSLRWLR